ncbi:MAG: hypothetical protein BWY49_01185 [Candidatus Omnitrophica bacterium ADurb.Bin314]|nr:MAG: hypothetical protein BWY49_01185 [Candidatus Omnitrophica bacterium ADurb.Bin314]
MWRMQKRFFVPFFIVCCVLNPVPAFSRELVEFSTPDQANAPGQGQAVSANVSAGEASDPFPSGLLAIADYKYPVYLYAPKGYRADRSYAMIMVAPSEGAKAEEGIEYFRGLADREMFFVLSTEGLWTEDDDVPTNLDVWLLQIKKDVLARFPVDQKRVFLVGRDSGAQYAAYLAMRYPAEFSGAALIGQAWSSSFAILMRPSPNPEKQVPFIAAFRADQAEVKAKNQEWLDKLQMKGYPLKVVDVPDAAGFNTSEFKKETYAWLETTSQRFGAVVEKGKKGFKSKLKKGIKDFFTV